MTTADDTRPDDDLAVAIVGMSGRFPGARDVHELWRNVRAGVCSVTWLDSDGAADAPEDAAFVRAAYLMERSDCFDAEFFGFSPREAELLDPQHRVFLECAWSAMEDGGLDPARFEGTVGVWGGSGHNSYLTDHVLAREDLVDAAGGKQVLVTNRADYLTSRVAYKLGLTGPAVTVQTACSTSLVAVAQACQSLLAFECDAALAGGAAVGADRHEGYRYQEDGILSPDGLTRTLDRRAGGTVGGDGVGVVLLKRFEDAVGDGDEIRAVIRGFAVNNDGAHRVGFSAPGAETQARVVRQAMDAADVGPEDIQYVELHGTATSLGDPIEIAALAAAFEGAPPGTAYLGAVKPNVGHLDAAAGVVGLIKTVLALRHREVPPLAHFEAPNERLRLESTPFLVPREVLPWPETAGPRRAGVSSFGLGGTNAHVVLEEAPPPPSRSMPQDSDQLLTWSARTAEDLDRLTERLSGWLVRTPGLELRDVAATLQRGRRSFPHRRALVATDPHDAVDALAPESGRLLEAIATVEHIRPVAFLVGGLGAEHPGMARELYAEEPVFRDAVDECAEIVARLGVDITTALLEETSDSREHPIHQPRTGYPSTFAFELGLARLWESWGVVPAAMVGHSLGEYLVAHLAGVFGLDDVLTLVVRRAELLEEHAAGAMLAVPLPEADVRTYLGPEVSVAAVNDSFTTVLAGTSKALERVARELDAAGVVSQRLASPYAFHSPLVEPALAEYHALLERVPVAPPKIPFVSNLTGTWITDKEATDPAYWVQHMRQPVRYADAVGELWTLADVVLLELGLGQTLTAGAVQHPARRRVEGSVIPSLPGGQGSGATARASLLRAAGRLWLAGGSLAEAIEPDARLVSAPTYPFHGSRYWIDPGRPTSRRSGPPARQNDPDGWLHVPMWSHLPLADELAPADEEWLVFTAAVPWCEDLVGRLRESGRRVTTISGSSAWTERADGFDLDVTELRDLARLVPALATAGRVPDRVVFVLPDDGFGLLVRWAQASRAWLEARPQRWDVITSRTLPVAHRESLDPAAASVGGACRVLGQEYPHVTCTQLDLAAGEDERDGVVAQVVRALASVDPPAELALSEGQWWTRGHLRVPPRRAGTPLTRPGGRYVVTGGLGRIGRVAVRVLAEAGPVHVLVLGRSAAEAATDLAELVGDGTTVDVRQVDVSDADQVRTAVEEFRVRHGGIDGVVHCAGLTGPAAHAAVPDIAPGDLAAQHHPKLHGVENLRLALTGERLDFALICSSIASVLGGLEFATYAAANVALDAFAARSWTAEQPWCSVGWEAWSFEADERSSGPGLGAAVRDLALTPHEGAELFRRLLSVPQTERVVVSTGDLEERIETWRSPAAVVETTSVHERPELHTPYVAPTTPDEITVAGLWRQVLGLDRVGVNDTFFELGGTSLLGLQIVHRLRGELSVSLPLSSIYAAPTVRTLAQLVGTRPADAEQEKPS